MRRFQHSDDALATSAVTRACTCDGSIIGTYGERFRPWYAVSRPPNASCSCHADATLVSHIMREACLFIDHVPPRGECDGDRQGDVPTSSESSYRVVTG